MVDDIPGTYLLQPTRLLADFDRHEPVREDGDRRDWSVRPPHQMTWGVVENEGSDTKQAYDGKYAHAHEERLQGQQPVDRRIVITITAVALRRQEDPPGACGSGQREQ